MYIAIIRILKYLVIFDRGNRWNIIWSTDAEDWSICWRELFGRSRFSLREVEGRISWNWTYSRFWLELPLIWSLVVSFRWHAPWDPNHSLQGSSENGGLSEIIPICHLFFLLTAKKGRRRNAGDWVQRWICERAMGDDNPVVKNCDLLWIYRNFHMRNFQMATANTGRRRRMR